MSMNLQKVHTRRRTRTLINFDCSIANSALEGLSSSTTYICSEKPGIKLFEKPPSFAAIS